MRQDRCQRSGRPFDSRPALLGFGYLSAIVGVALPAMLVIALAPTFHLWWVEEFEAPELQTKLGVIAVQKELRLPNGDTLPFLVVDSVTPGGPFDRAGVRASDVFVGLQHGPLDLSSELLRTRDRESASIELTTIEELERGGGHHRKVTILSAAQPSRPEN